MTAPDARQNDELRDLIAAAYAKWAEAPFEPAEWQRQNGHHLADALLPVVTAWAEAQARARAAEELRKAAEAITAGGRPDLTTTEQVQAVNDTAEWLDHRAAALTTGDPA